MNYYPPGFGSPRDWDHVDGPLSDEVVKDERCPDCGRYLSRIVWRASATMITCDDCGYEREEELEEEPIG